MSLYIPDRTEKACAYDGHDALRDYVLALHRLEELLKDGVKEGNVVITENEIETDKTFDIYCLTGSYTINIFNEAYVLN